jgi:hypothetical protein
MQAKMMVGHSGLNAYDLYRTMHLYTWKKRRKTRKSSKVTYKFQHQIALAWILSGSDASCQGTKSVHTISAIDSECTSSFSKAKKVSDASLDPNNGSLCIWLDDNQHFPIISTNKRPLVADYAGESSKKRV